MRVIQKGFGKVDDGTVVRIDENGKFINRVIPKKASYSGYEALQCIGKDDGIFIMNQLSLSKREVFENISFPEGRVCEDAAVAHQFYMNKETDSITI